MDNLHLVNRTMFSQTITFTSEPGLCMLVLSSTSSCTLQRPIRLVHFSQLHLKLSHTLNNGVRHPANTLPPSGDHTTFVTPPPLDL